MGNRERQMARNVRRKLARKLKQGQHTLRVRSIGGEGFVLGAMTGNSFVGFSRMFDLQKQVGHGK
jgi:hypothetical protein